MKSHTWRQEKAMASYGQQGGPADWPLLLYAQVGMQIELSLYAFSLCLSSFLFLLGKDKLILYTANGIRTQLRAQLSTKS